MKMHARLALALMAAACPWPLLAQSAPANPDTAAPTNTAPAAAAPAPDQVNTPAAVAPNAPANTEAAQDVLVLNPFEVSTSTDHGYEATQTLAGTRIRTNLGDVAASISVVNKQMLEDIDALDIGTVLQYTTNAQVAGTEGTYAGVGTGQTFNEQNNLVSPQSSQRIRGLAAADNTLDYFITDIPWDTYDIDRIDILRGPNSFLYGLGSPAGIVNASVKQAQFRDFGEISQRFASYGSTRATLDANYELIPDQLAFRLNTMYDDRKYEQKQAFQNQARISGALRYDPLFKGSQFHTSIKARAEAGHISADRPRIIPPNDAITPYWRPNAITASNPLGGMGQMPENNPYDPWDTNNIVAGNGRGTLESGNVNSQPYLTDYGNQQQPYWLFNGSNGQLLAVDGGYINVGALSSSNGTPLPASAGLSGKGTNMQWAGLANLPQAAAAYGLPGYIYGQYKNMSLQDPSVFNFYDNLIDGPTKQEYEKWADYNVDVTETGFNDRLGLDLTFDRQNYERGNQALLGYSPTLTLDVMKNPYDYYLNPGADGETSITNPDFGRPYVEGATNNGGGLYRSVRQVQRVSLFGELLSSDFFTNDLVNDILGSHRFNLVANNEQFWNQQINYQQYANSQAWDGYWNGNAGNTNAFTNRPPQAFIYLGPSVINRPTSSGLNIPAINSPINLTSHSVYVFDSTYNSTQPYNAPWTPAANLAPIYNQTGTATPLQNTNPANYVGWNSNFNDQLLESNDGVNPQLYTLDELSFRETISYSGSYQAYLFNDALVATLGWRYDEVETKSATAQSETSQRGMLDTSPADFYLPNGFPLSGVLKGHSTAAGLVLHLNDLLPKRYQLPINISGSFNDSKNFQVTSLRTDVYGNPLPNPLGKTKEYGIELATKDDKFSIRVVKYNTLVQNGAASPTPSSIGTVIAQGLRYRNVFLYQLGVYTLDTANEPAPRNNWNQAYPNLTPTQAQQQEDQAISTWNSIQEYLEGKGFFQAWNFTPTGPDNVLVTRTQYLTNPAAYQPTFNTVSAYVATPPQGFTVTADTDSKGYEFDATANPTRNWRIAFNAAEATATESNVGGSTLPALVSYLNSQLDPGGTPGPAALMPQFGNASLDIQNNQWAPFLQSYTLLQLLSGTAVPELRKWSYNLITSYDFDHGWMRGVGIGGAYRWEDKVVLGYPINAATGTYELNMPYYGPAEDGVDLWASYSRPLTNKIGWKIQLNITNAFARNGLIPISYEPDGQYAAVRTKPIQEWALTNTFSF